MRAATGIVMLLCLTAAGTVLAGAPDSGEVRARQAELAELRERLEGLRDALQSDLRNRDALGARLRDAEKAAARAGQRLAEVRRKQAENRSERSVLEDRRRSREAELEDEREALSGQIRSAFINGRGERLKLLLNQQDPARLGRQVVYYGYFTRARSARILAVLEHLAELARLDSALAEVASRLEALEADARAELRSREQARQERAAVLVEIERRIGERGSQIERLEQEETALGALIRDLRAVMSGFPVQGEQPFTALRGKLSWPVPGRLLHDFGQARAGGAIRWNGVVIAAEAGTPVRAVARGRVTYADWLPGLGLLVILDHGGGYLSLYGHNDTINRNVGEWVNPGDVIATVGESGGRRDPALYFEIREGARPENPGRWMSGAPKPG